VRNLERAGISRSVAMKLTGHKTEAVYRQYAIVAESDLREAGTKLSEVLAPQNGQQTRSKEPGAPTRRSVMLAPLKAGPSPHL
jgi:hypothetical protein